MQIIMIFDVGFPLTARSHWTGAWSSYFGLRTFTDHNGCDSISSFKQARTRKQSFINSYLAVVIMTIGMAAFVAQELVPECIEPHPGPERYHTYSSHKKIQYVFVYCILKLKKCIF